MKITDWEKRVRQLEREGLTRSDAQGVADSEMKYGDPLYQKCERCDGSGEEPGAPVDMEDDPRADCGHCHGTGRFPKPRPKNPAPTGVSVYGQDMYAALLEVELSCTRARIASRIGRKKNRTDFLLSSLQLIADEARAILNKVEGGK